jgi:hypothetical protein
MSEFSGRSTAISVRSQTSGDLASMPLGRCERIWEWLLRFLLPALLGLCVQLVYWLWSSTPYGLDLWSISGGALLVVVSMLIALWTWQSWLPFDRERLAKPALRIQLRHVALVIVTLAVVGGFVGLNLGHNGPQASAQISAPA